MIKNYLFSLGLLFSFETFGASLPVLKIDSNAISVSGVSSGAYMAVQLGVAFSKTISGVASIAGGAFWCAKGDSTTAQTKCMGQPNTSPSSEQISEAKRLAHEGLIDPLENLRNQRIQIFASPKDTIINPTNSVKLSEFYSEFIDPSQIHFVKNIEAAHGFPTLDKGNQCNFAMLPWILKCNYDEAGELLKVLYGNLNPRGNFEANHLSKFSQSDFGNAQTPLFQDGWIYVPTDCANGEKCKLHIALHGCQMNPDFIQDQFARLAGYNEWAETNRIVVLYPQSAKLVQVNPYACWDWFGFTGKGYVTQNAPQMAAVKKMIDTLLQSQ